MLYVPERIARARAKGNRDTDRSRAGSNSTADFFVDGIRDDVQYYPRASTMSTGSRCFCGPNAMIFAAAAAAGSSTARPRKPGPTGSLLARCQSTAMPVSATTDAETPLANGLGARINAAYERFNISATMSKAIAPGLIRRSAGSSATIPA